MQISQVKARNIFDFAVAQKMFNPDSYWTVKVNFPFLNHLLMGRDK